MVHVNVLYHYRLGFLLAHLRQRFMRGNLVFKMQLPLVPSQIQFCYVDEMSDLATDAQY